MGINLAPEHGYADQEKQERIVAFHHVLGQICQRVNSDDDTAADSVRASVGVWGMHVTNETIKAIEQERALQQQTRQA